jgi:para-nitrobenzyl esterase
LGACHALELAFVFDTLATGALMAGEAAPRGLAEQMHRAWVAFGRDGDAGWPRWTPEHPAVMTFGAESCVVEGPRADELALWT